jgi:hypothetical protein
MERIEETEYIPHARTRVEEPVPCARTRARRGREQQTPRLSDGRLEPGGPQQLLKS